ncbi:MAG TPA: 5-formyltetrahydrofolate cyclo-ligase [Sandaracinaceae bacterium LLY-WYZ-13_1]|nr:5-formyltetrahydrofolate cyclo-ligase [Sandaracinaceae bacterium LLY-WYZ-13_1]
MRQTDPEEEAYLRAQVKEEIRRRRRSVRRALPRAARLARSEAICERVLALPEWSEARTVLAFVSMPKEVQTTRAVEAAWAAGKRVATTRMNATFDGLELREWREGDELEESGMMFLQPPADAPWVPDDEVDLVLVPALAVDERGHRVGYGKGFYDRLLPRLTRALRVGLVFDFERIAEVPDWEGDQPVDVVVTDARTERTGADGAPRAR